MSNSSPQFTQPSDPSHDATSISETDSTSSWDGSSEASSEDSEEDEGDSLLDDGCADEAFWEEDTAVNAWLARFPGGTPILYPQLFVVKPSGGKVLTPSRYPDKVSLLHLPPEIRNQIYEHYFHSDEEVKHPKKMRAPFRNSEGIEMQRIYLSSENVELKFWLSTALLQTSRQLRLEAMFILFGTFVMTVEWLPVLPRLVEFLGKRGCTMLRYLDIWDALNIQGDNNAKYQDIIASIQHLSNLQHLRIVAPFSCGHLSEWQSDRCYSWFDGSEWKQDGTLTEHAVPKMRHGDIKKYWPEYELLKDLKSEKFTLAVENHWTGKYLEFDRSYGAYPGISQSMQSHAAQSPLSSANPPIPSISPQAPEAFQIIRSQPGGSTLTPNTESEDEDSDKPIWQETDTLSNKTIPFYNFVREFFHKNFPLGSVPPRGALSTDKFVAFPTARKSTGSIMRDCPFCYLSERHCGHHAVPDRPPFNPQRPEGGDEEVDVKILEERFENMSYVEMRKVCQDVVWWINGNGEFMNIADIFACLGWPETPNSEFLARLDAAVKAGWTGKRVDKDEVPPWDVLYREFHA